MSRWIAFAALIVHAVACDSALTTRICPTEPQSLTRVLADDSLHTCEVTTIGYYTPTEHSILYLSRDDFTYGNLSGGLFLRLDQKVDDRGHYVTLKNGARASEMDGPIVLQLTGTVMWENDAPVLKNIRDLVTWAPRAAPHGVRGE